MTQTKLTRTGSYILYLFSIFWGIAQNILWTFTSYFGAVIGNTNTEQGILTSVRNVYWLNSPSMGCIG
jgi:hypothetical protein